MPTFSTALLVGGASKRMGRDKALIELPGTGQLLWQRQWQVLADLRPAELFWSGPPRASMPAHAQIIPDLIANAGPLAGIAACLQALRSDLLIVLAVDLPQMTAPFLARLLTHCAATQGAVIQHGDYFEPLAAIYPRRLHPLAAEHLSQGRYALQDFIRESLKQEALTSIPLNPQDAPLFQNWNTPEDLRSCGK